MAAMHTFLVAGALALAACSSVASDGAGKGSGSGSDAIADGSTFSMRPGQAVTLADRSVLRYVRLVNDSRCMPDVQCVWAGNAELAFEWRSGAGGAEAFSLHTGKSPAGDGAKQHALGERTLTLVSVARSAAPEAELRIAR